MTNQDYWCVFASSAKVRRVIDFTKQSLAKIVDGESAFFTLSPVRVIAKAVNSDIFKSWLCGKPLLRPIMFDVLRLAPRFP